MFHLTRKNWFYTKTGTLVYSESVPHKERCDKFKCNCTKDVSKRPNGNPDNITQYLEYHTSYEKYNLSLHLSTGNYIFYWDEKPYEENRRWVNPHAYFLFNHNACAGGKIENMINVSISKPRYGKTNNFSGNLYFGNTIDASCFFNGHSPSRIVKLEEIGEDSLWVHDNGCIGESMAVMPNTSEADIWRNIHKKGNRVIKIADNLSLEKSVEDIYKEVSTNVELKLHVDELTDWFVEVIDNLEDTVLYKICDKVKKESWGEEWGSKASD